MPKHPSKGCLLGGRNPSTDEVNVEILLESLAGAACGIVAAWLLNHYLRRN